MAQDLAVYETALAPMIPTFADLLGPIMDPKRLIRTVMISIERTPELMKCSMQSIVMGTTTFAVLGLEVDGVTGQGYLLPMGGHAQPVIGYKGYNTLGDRSGIAINGGVIREGDEYEYELGSDPFVRVKPALLPTVGRPILAAWSTATRPGRTPLVSVLPYGDLLAVKSRSPGAKRSASPWNDEAIGFPAMCEKTAKRRLARSMPLHLVEGMQRAAALEESFEERGRLSYLRPDGNLVHAQPIREAADADILGPAYVIEFVDGTTRTLADIGGWTRGWQKILSSMVGKPEALKRYRDLNEAHFDALARHHGKEVADLRSAIEHQLDADAGQGMAAE